MTAPSPTSYAPGGQYSPYPPQNPHDLPQQSYAPHAHPGWRPEWGPYPPNLAYNTHTSPSGLSNQSSPTTATPRPMDKSRRKRLSQDQHSPLTHTQQVYSFVPIPGAQQHKRPRRRYEEIERMYKCGYNGCDKAYGTLNHLNAHVTMQSHGPKRTPEEFKEIRKEWKQRKKEEEQARKAEDEQQRLRQVEVGNVVETAQQQQNGAGQYSAIPPRQLPPLGYQQSSVQTGMHHHYSQPSAAMDPLQQYPPATIYANYSHTSPYSHNQSQAMYQPRQTTTHTGAEENDADADPDPDVPSAYTHN